MPLGATVEPGLGLKTLLSFSPFSVGGRTSAGGLDWGGDLAPSALIPFCPPL